MYPAALISKSNVTSSPKSSLKIPFWMMMAQTDSCDGILYCIMIWKTKQYLWSSKHVDLLKTGITGYFCGEIDIPKTYISESPSVKIIFHSDSYTEESYFSFYVSVERSNEFYQRLGQYHQTLHQPNRRGILIPNSYCDRIFENCRSPGHCYIQSPGFPEIYPRNLKCR